MLTKFRAIIIALGLMLWAIHPQLLPEKKKSPETTNARVRLGNERALTEFPDTLQGKRIGLVINHTSVLSDGTPLLKAFREGGINVSAIFSPEHGFSGTEEAGITIKDSTFKSIPVFSLYGKTRRPTAAQLKHMDVFVYDIQDVGTRFYTYITTLKYVLEAASKANKEVYVLDRPNPIGGHIVEGPLLKERHQSFIGACPVPIRYGLTVGELALMMRGERWVPEDVALHVIKMESWKRDLFWKDTGLSWVPTSPNIPKPETCIAYPGMGFLGGVLINHGLGTLNPFLQFGAPWLDTELIGDDLGGGKAFGIALEKISYTPLSMPGKVLHPPYENRTCQGLRIRILNEEKFLSVRFTLAVIKALRQHHPSDISPQINTLNRHFGDDTLVQYLDGHVRFETMMAKIVEDEKSFLSKRQKYLLYD